MDLEVTAEQGRGGDAWIWGNKPRASTTSSAPRCGYAPRTSFMPLGFPSPLRTAVFPPGSLMATPPPRLSNKFGRSSFLTTFQNQKKKKKKVTQESAKVRESGLNWSSYASEAQIEPCVAFGPQRPKLRGPTKGLCH